MSNGIEEVIGGAQVVNVVCNQLGDSGKGKVVQRSAEWADVIARGTGGSNAGHTIIHNDQTVVLHLVPAGIVYDNIGKVNVIGSGTVIDLVSLTDELSMLDKLGVSYNHLMVSSDAHVVMPYHILRDRKLNRSLENGGIGSTGKGISPCYEDSVGRRGIRLLDFKNKDSIREKIGKALKYPYYPEFNRKQKKGFLEDAIDGSVWTAAQNILQFICDTRVEMDTFLRDGKKILLEGAQGLVLSYVHGTYPFVTSSNPSADGTAIGSDISPRAVDLTIGLVKFPFMTRVGGGSFPTELGGVLGEEYCRETGRTKEEELKTYDIPHTSGEKVSYNPSHPKIVEMMNASDPLTKAAGIRLSAGEFGATTGRPRRVGWTDAAIAKYAMMINGGVMILTKADCLAGIDSFSIGYDYVQSSGYAPSFPRDEISLRSISPNFRHYPGYGSLREVSSMNDLPASLQGAILDFEEYTNGRVVGLSTGPGKDDLIFRRK